MKIRFTLLFTFICTTFIFAQENKQDNTTIDNLISNLYGVISGEKGEARDWDAFNNLYYQNARLIPSGKNKDGITGARYMTPQDYIDGSGKWLVENGFHEIEISREVQQFGTVAHVFSTYEAKKSKSDTEPFMRGINSIQLLNDGTRWWILNIYWTQESEENPIPEKYLPK
ncbi:hypothetical protein [Urechidicola vernalis]|uniref:Nuclear transport factor 2 family protein n=1 Tax=Urechidicola vernalis TaxID=3075600 RepID=A0ABU2Y107_9FLAO|nr:hypothetical protein [Urechidicola sp. P050]MDT0551825.1 hypothetical protein [Urechidicola sp. P050]